MDTAGIGITLGLVNGAIDAAKKAVGIAKDLNSLELKEQVGDVFNAILDLKVRLLELDEENRTLKAQLDAKENIKFDPSTGLFYKDGEQSPLCPACYQGKEHLVAYLAQTVSGSRPYHHCKICKNNFDPPGH